MADMHAASPFIALALLGALAAVGPVVVLVKLVKLTVSTAGRMRKWTTRRVAVRAPRGA